MIHPLQAPVRPRVVSPETGDAVPLDEVIQSLASQRTIAAVQLVGDARSGKTTALSHLAAALDVDSIVYLDEPEDRGIEAAGC